MSFPLPQKYYWLFLILLGLVTALGLFVPLMNNDSAHHANIALHMHTTGDYVSLIDHGADYLDKPHFHFWLAALSYAIFGVNTFAYKFPSFLFSVLAVYSTYKLGNILYNVAIGKLAVLILASAFAFIAANNDVRMDAILTGSIIFSIWQLTAFIQTDKWHQLLLGCMGAAIAFATKGMIGVAMPAIAIFIHLVYQRKWKKLFYWKWLLAPVFIGLFISPVLYCYYIQFDLHPEKVIRGQSVISGVKFILWSQNLERLDGSTLGSAGKNDPFFFLHTFLWAFLPWCLLAFTAYWKVIIRLAKKRFRLTAQTELLTWGTITFIFIIISMSGFKLPHYLNILFPLIAILTAAFLYRINLRKKHKAILVTQSIVAAIMFILICIINLWLFPPRHWLISIICLVFIVGAFILLKQTARRQHALLLSCWIAVFMNFLLNANFYPQLLSYQAGNTLAAQVTTNKEIYYLQDFESSNSFDFYQGKIIPHLSLEEASQATEKILVYTGDSGLDALKESGFDVEIIHTDSDYRITRLKKEFLNPATRAEVLKKHYILKITNY